VTRFRFRLESVLAWRAAQLEAEEQRLRQLVEERAAVERGMAEVEAARMEAERQVRRAGDFAAADLWALAAYREAARLRTAALAVRLRECEDRITAQRERVAAARRRTRLLERLRERRFEEWRYLENREMEQFAGDAFLARWKRR
jgi:flagellar FliJ protein